MPYYEYQCTQCRDTFGKNLKIAERLIPCESPCEKCGGAIKQIITSGLTRVRPSERPPDDWVSFTNAIKQRNPGADFTTWGLVGLGLILIFQEIEPLLEWPPYLLMLC